MAAVRPLESYRDEFPVVGRKAYLISASLGPVSGRAKRRLQEYVDVWEDLGAPEPVWFRRIFPEIRDVKAVFAALIGADPGELAITTNVSMALSSVLSCLDLSGERNRIVLTELDFPTDGHVALAQRRRGAEVVFLRSPDGLSVPTEAFAEAIDERTAAVILNRVLYRSSALLDVEEICRLARDAGAWTVLDDFHGAGILPIDVHEVGCDFYTTGVLKWLCGGPGLTFLYARRDLLPQLEPTVTGWWGQREPFGFHLEELDWHPTARRLETGTHPAPVAFVARGGLEIIAEVGPERIRERQGELTDHVMERADAAGLAVRTPRDRKARGGVVNVGVGERAGEIADALFERDVCVDHRGDGLRISPHFFNVEGDIDRLFEELAGLT
ncbi:MAG TPA: aminotransferase class V-fold PLP-dependent enzyme [Actinomycetota bacterium]|nr:aminotransferase class V-fold PLP-dependent enzyme [Actinomycetota bacterium]